MILLKLVCSIIITSQSLITAITRMLPCSRQNGIAQVASCFSSKPRVHPHIEHTQVLSLLLATSHKHYPINGSRIP